MTNNQPDSAQFSTLLPADQYYGTSHEPRRTTRTYSWSHRNNNNNTNGGSSNTHDIGGTNITNSLNNFHFNPQELDSTINKQNLDQEEDSSFVQHQRNRRLSHDEKPIQARKFLLPVEETIRLVLEQEDTNGDFQISITDSGPKLLSVGTVSSNGYKKFDIRGQYMISNLLQELALASSYGRKHIVLDEGRLTENPVDRLSRMIKTTFWPSLTRRIDEAGLLTILTDPKDRSSTQARRIYVPHGEAEILAYYQQVASQHPQIKLIVEELPKLSDITPSFVRSLNDRPGILALAMKKVQVGPGHHQLQAIPFVVPGARFNELYNWDSYFISIGLLIDDHLELAQGIVEHFVFEINHYGKILNGNRSYYLCRSQPPFLTDFALQVYSRLHPLQITENKIWLAKVIKAAIKEYHTVWMAKPRLEPRTGLSRYRPDGIGVPPETESSHFTHVLQPYAQKHSMSVNEFIDAYNQEKVHEPELDEYFTHDRAVRESGHDTTYRFEGVCADLVTIDLNSLLYKYEIDIATCIRDVFDDRLELDEEFEFSSFPFGEELPYSEYFDHSQPSPPPPPHQQHVPIDQKVQSSKEWFDRAKRRKQLIDHFLWNPGKSLFFDFNAKEFKQSNYESVTAFWSLWAGLASQEQAEKLVKTSLTKFEVPGGLVACTEASRGEISLVRPNRQWDYPAAWAPHQILAWVGLERYGFTQESQRTAYRWLYMMTKAFVDYNGVVPEKYDAIALNHLVHAEYGNQGVDFKMVPREGFGWCNTSYQLGLKFLNDFQRRALGVLVHPDELFLLAKPRLPTL
ncbi:alpha,alpha-trehalase nth1 [Puccinia graminis f. sp. tritici]|uniref:Trehalase n=1 Tax=Puccinia graminis f. sp. tritici TaxID=56615 RepID=A0A5B0NZD5_PUCGR|nr:alpha,alpha-trehalase nth1 [Puccinia graminis f. sp. tritici]KAA1094092.1 alpha,alpha-trehalase nth1 [Puccinia graminis f. sp. tritici]